MHLTLWKQPNKNVGKRFEQTLHKKRKLDAKQHMKRFSASLAFREIQNNMVMRCPYKPLERLKWNVWPYSPGWCCSVDGAPACELKGCPYNSQSGPMPGLQARSPFEGIQPSWEHVRGNLSMCLSLPSPLSKSKLKKKKKTDLTKYWHGYRGTGTFEIHAVYCILVISQ